MGKYDSNCPRCKELTGETSPISPIEEESTEPKIIKHKPDCTMAFGKKDPTCPRCIELLNGADPRKRPLTRDQQFALRLKRDFCWEHQTPIYMDKCPICGKPPYTD